MFDGRVVGLQFHLEWTEQALGALVAECADELEDHGTFVMTARQLMEGERLHGAAARERLFALLDDLERIGTGEPGSWV